MSAHKAARESTTAPYSTRRSKARREIDELIRSSTQSITGSAIQKEAFVHLLRMTQAGTELLSPVQSNRFGPRNVCETSLQGLANVSRYQKSWQQDPSTWEPPEGSRRRVFSSLLRHLFFGHEAPDLFVSSWLAEPTAEISQHHRWYLHICATGTIRGTDTPFKLNRLHARRFANAPHHMSVLAALHWAVNDAPYPQQIKPKGMSRRNWKAMQAARQEWHRTDWKPPINVPDFFWSEDDSDACAPTTWSIRQITRRNDLVNEGRELNHCVGSYVSDCMAGESAIFSLKRHSGGLAKRCLTIEVSPEHECVVTALGRNNSRPTSKTRQLMNRWAKQNNLRIRRGV